MRSTPRMADSRRSLARSEVDRRWRLDTRAQNKMRSGADRARRRHRHHVDRRHDGDDPRLRRVAARHDPRDRPEHRSSSSASASPASRTASRFSELLKRPNLTISDARAIEEQAPTHPARRHRAGRRAGAAHAGARLLPRPARRSRCSCSARPRTSPRAPQLRSSAGRFFNGTEVQYRKNVVVLGKTPYQALFAAGGTDPIGKMVRVGSRALHGRRRVRQAARRRRLQRSARTTSSSSRTRPTSGSSACAASASARRRHGHVMPIQIAVVPREGVDAGGRDRGRRSASCGSATACRLDEPDDFDIADAGRDPAAVGSDQPGARSSRSSSSRRSR